MNPVRRIAHLVNAAGITREDLDMAHAAGDLVNSDLVLAIADPEPTDAATITPDDYRADTPEYPWTARIHEGIVSEDITRELAVMYDLVTGSMDWGSGFLDREDTEAVLRIADLCGFEKPKRKGHSAYEDPRGRS